MSDLAGRRVLVTGAGGTIGRAVAVELAARGASVLLAGRTAASLEATKAALDGEGHAVLAFDVGDDDAWTAQAGALAGTTDVVAAAAVLTPVGQIGDYSPTDFWAAMQINVLGSLLAVHHTVDGLRAAKGSVIFFSGGGATKPLPRYDAYATSKAATVRLAENLSVSLAPDGVRINAIAPGFVASAMHEVTLDAGPDAVGADYFASTQQSLDQGGVPPERSAKLIGNLIAGAGGDVTGRLISAEWDPWEDPAFFDDLRAQADLGMLRRIDDMFFIAKQESA
jgi:NAD(P)-dependent dehydrogenase (short-subunit alcohol dehydrogenase family)